jgi:rhodanese-related sulfurtransferase
MLLKRLSTLALAAAAAITALAPAARVAAEEAPRMTDADLQKHREKGDVVVLDVRSLPTYRAGHIKGALSIPLEGVASRIDEIKGWHKAVVAYCS